MTSSHIEPQDVEGLPLGKKSIENGTTGQFVIGMRTGRRVLRVGEEEAGLPEREPLRQYNHLKGHSTTSR